MSKAGQTIVFDASALLALVQHEAGRDEVVRHLRGALVCAVNLAEVLSKLVERGVPLDLAVARLAPLPIQIVPFDAPLAHATAALRPATRPAGLSLGDRACLALGQAVGGTVLTTERAWDGLDVGVAVRRIR